MTNKKNCHYSKISILFTNQIQTFCHIVPILETNIFAYTFQKNINIFIIIHCTQPPRYKLASIRRLQHNS